MTELPEPEWKRLKIDGVLDMPPYYSADQMRDYGRAEYLRGRDECMAEWADHMKRINGALKEQT
jgi:hypothetical protein